MAQLHKKKATQKFMNKYREVLQKQDNMAKSSRDLKGPYFYQEGGKTYASLPLGMIQGIEQSPLFAKMQKDCEAEGIQIPRNIMAEDPRAHVLTPQEYLKKVADGTMPQMNNHEMLKEMATKAVVNDTT